MAQLYLCDMLAGLAIHPSVKWAAITRAIPKVCKMPVNPALQVVGHRPLVTEIGWRQGWIRTRIRPGRGQILALAASKKYGGPVLGTTPPFLA